MRLRSAAAYGLASIAALLGTTGSAVGVTFQNLALDATSATLSINAAAQVEQSSGSVPLSLPWNITVPTLSSTGTVWLSIVDGEFEFEVAGSIENLTAGSRSAGLIAEVSATFVVPNLGAPTTPIVFTFSQLSSAVSPEIGVGDASANSESRYLSAAAGKMATDNSQFGLSVSCCGINPGDEISGVAEYLPGDTVTVDMEIRVGYGIVVQDLPASFAETYRLRARVSVPTPVPEANQAAQLGVGFLLLLGLSRVRPGKRRR